jgi:hypothetical protein
MSEWKKLPTDLPVDGDTVWVRVLNYFSQPFLATFTLASVQFTSLVNNVVYPAWCVCRWLSALGLELIINGSFAGSTPWYATATWNIVAGKAEFLATATNVLGQPVSITMGKKYLLKFTILDLSTTSRFRFIGDAYTALFNGEYGIRNPHAAGIYSVEVTAAVSSTYFFIEGTSGDPTFSVTGFSLREIL